ncbi:HNH endonuclease signature motif containing protein [Streptomyces sp. NPDC001571]
MRDWADRFLDCILETPAGCWQWTGYLTPNGYGRLSVGGVQQYAHRLAYETFLGPIPPGLVIDHLCRNRGCMNPAHLDAVPQRLNVLRGENQAAHRARQSACLRGHRFDLANTYRAPNGTRKCRRCRANQRTRARHRQGVHCASA